MNKLVIPAVFSAALIFAAVPARADFMATATLNAAQELNPLTGMPPASSATGTMTLDFISATDTLDYTLTFSGLTSDTTMAHIHLGPPGQSGAPLLMIYDYGMPPSQNMTSDTMSGSLTAMDFMPDSVDGISTFAQAISAIESGNTYVNIHSTNYPAGEIRGQIMITSQTGPGGSNGVPEPASAGLFALGALLGGFGLLRRRRPR